MPEGICRWDNSLKWPKLLRNFICSYWNTFSYSIQDFSSYTPSFILRGTWGGEVSQFQSNSDFNLGLGTIEQKRRGEMLMRRLQSRHILSFEVVLYLSFREGRFFYCLTQTSIKVQVDRPTIKPSESILTLTWFAE